MEPLGERKSAIFEYLFYINIFFSLISICLLIIAFAILGKLVETNYDILIIFIGFIMWSLLGVIQFFKMLGLIFYWQFFNKKFKRTFISYWVFSLLVLIALLVIYYMDSHTSNKALIFLFAISLFPISISLILSGKMTETIIEKPLSLNL